MDLYGVGTVQQKDQGNCSASMEIKLGGPLSATGWGGWSFGFGLYVW